VKLVKPAGREANHTHIYIGSFKVKNSRSYISSERIYDITLNQSLRQVFRSNLNSRRSVVLRAIKNNPKVLWHFTPSDMRLATFRSTLLPSSEEHMNNTSKFVIFFHPEDGAIFLSETFVNLKPDYTIISQIM
jgi:hypothetical protein